MTSADDTARRDGSSPERFARATHRVLVVDDHPAYLRTVETVVAATAGFEVAATATTGAAALDRLVGHDDVDLVLLDVYLPDVNGIEVARRYAESGGHAVVVLMSSNRLDELPADALDRGVASFLPKELLTTETLRAAWAGAAGS